MKWVVVAVVVSLLVGEVLSTHMYEYGMMIDAGSSGSRLYIYQWLHREQNTIPGLYTSPLNQTQWSYKISPGLGTFYNNLDGIAAYLTPLITFAQSKLDQHAWHDTELYLKATGGLRALSQENQDNIMAKTREYFLTTSFNFSSDYASVISLEQEGTYGWLAVQYLTKSLGVAAATVGALDMGGATTEISFVPDSAPAANEVSVNLAGIEYDVYAGGYAARGLDTALDIVNSRLIQEQGGDGATTDIIQPCYFTDYAENKTWTSADGSTVYTLWGASNYSACIELVKTTLLNTSVECAVQPCAFNGVYQPALIDRQYYAYSGYFYSYDILFPDGRDVSLTEFAEASHEYCNQNVAEAQANHPNAVLSRLKNFCFTSCYISSILATYGFSDDTHIKFVSIISNTEVSWAVGAMLYEANLLPYYPNPAQGTTGDHITNSSAKNIPSAWLIGIIALLLVTPWL